MPTPSQLGGTARRRPHRRRGRRADAVSVSATWTAWRTTNTASPKVGRPHRALPHLSPRLHRPSARPPAARTQPPSDAHAFTLSAPTAATSAS